MPTKRTRRSRFGSDFMTETHFVWLRAEEFDRDRHDWLIWTALDRDDQRVIEPDLPAPMPYLASGIRGRRLWSFYEEEIVAEHIAETPGTRPYRWWQFSAPESRRRLRGVGTPCHERLAHVLCLHYGVPADWIMRSDVEAYVRIGTPLGVPALDPADPPMYESEAAYLDRLALLLPGERKRLRESDFEPESLLAVIEFADS